MVRDAPVPQLPAHDAGQMTAGGFTDIRDLKTAGILFVSGTHGRDDGDIPCLSGFNQAQLTGNQINGIYNIIRVQREKIFLMRLVVELGQGTDLGLRVDIPEPGRP